MYKENHANDEEDSQRDDTDVYIPCKLAHDADEHGAEEGSALSADVIEAEVLAGFFCRNDLGEVGAGEGLYTALKHAYYHCQNPEFSLGIQEEGKDGNTGISCNADGNQS